VLTNESSQLQATSILPSARYLPVVAAQHISQKNNPNHAITKVCDPRWPCIRCLAGCEKMQCPVRRGPCCCCSWWYWPPCMHLLRTLAASQVSIRLSASSCVLSGNLISVLWPVDCEWLWCCSVLEPATCWPLPVLQCSVAAHRCCQHVLPTFLHHAFCSECWGPVRPSTLRQMLKPRVATAEGRQYCGNTAQLRLLLCWHSCFSCLLLVLN
jgi:hypothetical protein